VFKFFLPGIIGLIFTNKMAHISYSRISSAGGLCQFMSAERAG
jgi:hypothetical protein